MEGNWLHTESLHTERPKWKEIGYTQRVLSGRKLATLIERPKWKEIGYTHRET